MATLQNSIIAGGCFWCVEAVFHDVIGVTHIESGYIGGDVPDPTYRQVCGGQTGHAEAIRVTYDADQLPLSDLFDIHMALHDPTQLNRQGNDVGTQYRSAIFVADDTQHAEAEAAIMRWNAENAENLGNDAAHGGGAVTTIEPETTWYPAEDYHQEYWEGDGKRNPYCLAMIPPKIAKLRKSFQAKVKSQSA